MAAINSQVRNKIIHDNALIIQALRNNISDNNDKRGTRLAGIQVVDIIGGFSLNKSSTNIKMAAVSTIDTYSKFVILKSDYPEDYSDFIWLLSLSILCQVDDEHFQKLVDIVERDGINDKLVDYLIKYRMSDYESSAGSYLHPAPYGKLDGVLNDEPKEGDVTVIKDYLDNHWYKDHGDKKNFDASWIDLHKDAPDRFFGYWAWETAAISKIKGLDDQELKGHQYYPYRAVHW